MGAFFNIIDQVKQDDFDQEEDRIKADRAARASLRHAAKRNRELYTTSELLAKMSGEKPNSSDDTAMKIETEEEEHAPTFTDNPFPAPPTGPTGKTGP